MTVRALFATVPARQKFLRPARTESAQISTIVRRYALGRPDIPFRLMLHGHLSFAADTTVTGLGNVQDEDVVYVAGNAWSVYFDGTARGLTSTNLDVDAFDVY